MVLINTTIQTFHAYNYGTLINKLSFHLPHVTILGGKHCGKTRQAYSEISHSFMDTNRKHYYAELLYF